MTGAALLCALLIAGPVGATELSGPAEITVPGDYRLATDVIGGGITVRSGDVALDGNGHRILGSPGEGTRGVLVAGSVTNVTVRNITLAGWEVGIEVRDAADVRVERVHAENCTANGIFIERCQGVEVTDCVANGNALPGIAVNATRTCRVLRTAAAGNADVGLYIAGSRDVAIEECAATSNGLNGVYLEKAEGVRIAGCHLEENGYPGLAAADTGGLAIVDNLASTNRLAAFWLERPTRTVVSRNVATGSEVGLVVRNESARPYTGSNHFLTARSTDGRTRTLPSLGLWVRHPKGAAPAP